MELMTERPGMAQAVPGAQGYTLPSDDAANRAASPVAGTSHGRLRPVDLHAALVISRSDGEEVAHIAWSQYMRF